MENLEKQNSTTELMIIQKRRAVAWDALLAIGDYEETVKFLTRNKLAPKTYSTAQLRKDINSTLQEMHLAQKYTAEELINYELRRLTEIDDNAREIFNNQNAAPSTKLRALEVQLQISESRRKLLGINSEKQNNTTDIAQAIIIHHDKLNKETSQIIEQYNPYNEITGMTNPTKTNKGRKTLAELSSIDEIE